MKKEQIEEIISKMTLHEKVLLCTGKNSWRTRDYEKLGRGLLFFFQSRKRFRYEQVPVFAL